MGLFDGILDTAKDILGDITSGNADDVVDAVTDIAQAAATAYALKKAYEYMTSPEDNTPQQPQQVSTSSAESLGTASQSGGTTINTSSTGSSSVQLGVSSDASIPLLYGRAQVRGTIFDAILTNGNSTLITAIMLAERTGAGGYGNADYTVNKVYLNDAELNLNANGTVANAILNDGTVSTKYNENTTVRVYAGDTDELPVSVTGVTPGYQTALQVMPHWARYLGYKLGGTVFALIEQDYDAQNGVQGVGTWTFDITNTTASNPGDVIYDYLTNGRYGAGYSDAEIDVPSLTGVGEESVSSRNDRTEIYLSLNPDDDANADVSNSTAFPMLVTQGNINNYTNYNIASYSGGNITANAFAQGTNTDDTNVQVSSNTFNRLKIFWANTNSSGNINNSMSGVNSLTGFLDIARPIPSGKSANYPGDVATLDSIAYTPTIAPNTSITNFLIKGDKIRPEGSPFIYTVSANVDVPSPGYETFTIPVYERVAEWDFANTTFGNVTQGTLVNDASAFDATPQQYRNDYENLGYYYIGGWPFDGATADGATTYPNQYSFNSNVLMSNATVGNAAMLSSHTSNVVLATESRGEINGLLNTQNTIQQNLNVILAHSEAVLSYDTFEGKWTGIPLGRANISGAYEFTDNNIIGEVNITTADFDSYYNKVRSTYVDLANNGSKKEVILYTPDVDKNANEVNKQMELAYPLSGSASRAARLSGVELAQNRNDLTLQFRSDYSSIIVKPGDIVKISVGSYGFDEKLFRILSAKQNMADNILVMDFVALEYQPGIYTSDSDGGGEATGAGAAGGGGGSGAGFAGGGSGSGLGNPEGNPDPIGDDPGGFDPDIYVDLTDGGGISDGTLDGNSLIDNSVSGTVIIDNSLDGDSLIDNSVDPIKLAFAFSSVQKICLNEVYTANWADPLNIVGGSGRHANVDFDIPSDGLYTIECSFINPMGASNLDKWRDSGLHTHEGNPLGTAPGTYEHVEVSTTPSVYKPVLGINEPVAPGNPSYATGIPSTNDNLVYDLRTNGPIPDIEANIDGGNANVWTMPTEPIIQSEVDVTWYSEAGSLRSQTFKITVACSSAVVTIPFTLGCDAGSKLTITNWEANYQLNGFPWVALRQTLPGSNGTGGAVTTDIAAKAEQVAAVAPTVTVTGAGSARLN